tara:strand:- start:18580 stop:18990 length:411 start_codon:yes stop_codon:yes gene_type:complete
MNAELKMYYNGDSFEAIANFRGITERSIKSFLLRERDKLGLTPRTLLRKTTLEFIADKSLVMELYQSGMSQDVIAVKWDISLCTAHRYLSAWCDDIRPEGYSVNLSEFYSKWRDTPDEFVVTIANQPMFKVTRIDR